MLYRIYFFIAMTIGLTLCAHAQPSFKRDAIRSMSVLNSQHSSFAKLTSGKYILIDFFATYCVPCLRELPRLDSLQKQLGDRLQIVVVTNEKKEDVEQFFKKRISIDNFSLPVITDDVQLNGLFPHVIVPHEVWIDKKDAVKAITSHEELTRNNILQFIGDGKLNVITKADNVEFNHDRPLLSEKNNINDSFVISRSSLTGFTDGIGTVTRVDRDSTGNITRYISTSTAPLFLFFDAYTKFTLPSLNRKLLVFNSQDSANIFDFRHQKLINYELSLPHGLNNEVFFKFMLDDLNRYFPMIASISKQPALCLVISRQSFSDSILQSKGGPLQSVFQDASLRNCPISSLVNYLRQFKDVEPVVNETGINFNVDMDFDFPRDLDKNLDIEALRKSLLKYGLVVSLEERYVDVLNVGIK